MHVYSINVNTEKMTVHYITISNHTDQAMTNVMLYIKLIQKIIKYNQYRELIY